MQLSKTFSPGLAGTTMFWNSVSQIARIAGVNHGTQLINQYF
jgi:hypothetical protein